MGHFTDIPQGAIKARLPPWLTAYIELARLDRPIGIWLLLFPCFWGLALANNGDHRLYALFAIGAVVMRGAGCTLNDIVDRKIDSSVERTMSRPLPSGRIGFRGAIAFLIIQLLVGFPVLLQFNVKTIVLGCASLGLVAIYPLMKRVTWWPQLVLGLAFNWGVLMAWSAARDEWPPLPACLLYASGIAWTLAYDTIYAHQDLRDDAIIGIKSTARRFGASAKMPIGLFYGIFLTAAAWAGGLVDLALVYYATLGAVAVFALIVLWRWKADQPASCRAAFRANRWIGLAVFAAIVAGQRCL